MRRRLKVTRLPRVKEISASALSSNQQALTRPSSTTGDNDNTVNDNTVPELESSWKQGTPNSGVGIVCNSKLVISSRTLDFRMSINDLRPESDHTAHHKAV
ncbi:hypothetical protein H2248_003384 [Termitomyces sp. 'cryptogamus']|nr:hypothetical protein H2248_003384 [Termitomyces sp. 'cryptogamus']